MVETLQSLPGIKYDYEMTIEHEHVCCRKYVFVFVYFFVYSLERQRKERQARQDQMFPDEVDTPMDTPARIRFQK